MVFEAETTPFSGLHPSFAIDHAIWIKVLDNLQLLVTSKDIVLSSRLYVWLVRMIGADLVAHEAWPWRVASA